MVVEQPFVRLHGFPNHISLLLLQLGPLHEAAQIALPLIVQNQVVPLHTCNLTVLLDLGHKSSGELSNLIKCNTVSLSQNLKHEASLGFAQLNQVKTA